MVGSLLCDALFMNWLYIVGAHGLLSDCDLPAVAAMTKVLPHGTLRRKVATSAVLEAPDQHGESAQ